MDELRQVLAAAGSLFHVTHEDRAALILERGFDPAEAYRINGGIYSIGPFANRGFNCFVTEPRLHRVLQMFDDGMGDGLGDRLILRVPAHVVAERTFDLDRTRVTIERSLRGIDVPEPELCRRLLAEVGYVVCFDPISCQHVELVGKAVGHCAEPRAASNGGQVVWGIHCSSAESPLRKIVRHWRHRGLRLMAEKSADTSARADVPVRSTRGE